MIVVGIDVVLAAPVLHDAVAGPQHPACLQTAPAGRSSTAGQRRLAHHLANNVSLYFSKVMIIFMSGAGAQFDSRCSFNVSKKADILALKC